jgi:hypothetical protein
MQCDPPRWERELEDWAERYGETRCSPSTRTSTSGWRRPSGRFHDAGHGRTLTHDGDPVLARHIANARTKETRWGLVITKEHKDSPRRIDAAVAAVLAHDGLTAPLEARRPNHAPVLARRHPMTDDFYGRGGTTIADDPAQRGGIVRRRPATSEGSIATIKRLSTELMARAAEYRAGSTPTTTASTGSASRRRSTSSRSRSASASTARTSAASSSTRSRSGSTSRASASRRPGHRRGRGRTRPTRMPGGSGRTTSSTRAPRSPTPRRSSRASSYVLVGPFQAERIAGSAPRGSPSRTRARRSSSSRPGPASASSA